jgi:hypothetical protein
MILVDKIFEENRKKFVAEFGRFCDRKDGIY